MLDLRREPGNLPLLVAHRGASALAPENTLAAFGLAVEGGADVIELDVHLSSDGRVVVLHDSCLRRTTNGRGWVDRKTLAQLKTLDAGRWFGPGFAGEPIPTLAEVLDWAREQSARLMIEFKGGSKYLERGLVEKSVQLINEREMADEVIFISSHHPFLARARDVAPEIATGPIIKLSWFERLLFWLERRLPRVSQSELAERRRLRPLQVGQSLRANWLSIPMTLFGANLIGAAHAAGLTVSPADADWDFPTVIALGADTVSADDPAQARKEYFSPQAGGDV
jgi:glycerophosphoryl diester phosphodiesterase